MRPPLARDALLLVPVLLAIVSLAFGSLDLPPVWRWLALQVIGLAVLATLLGRSGEPSMGWRPHVDGPGTWILLLVGWVGLGAAFQPAGGRSEQAQLEFSRWLIGAGIYFAAVRYLSGREHVGRWLIVLAGLGIVAALGGAGSWAAGRDRWAGGGFGNPQLVAAILVILLPFGAALCLRGTSDLQRSLGLGFLGAGIPVLFLTQSRSGWAAAAVSLAVMVRVLPPREGLLARHRVVPTLLTLALLAGVFAWGFPEAVRQVGSRASTLQAPLSDASLQWRFRLWSAALEMAGQRPVLGWGPGSFPLEAGARAPEAPGSLQVASDGPSLSSLAHNEYLQTAAEQGLIGLALYLAILGSFFVQARRAWPRLQGDTRRMAVAAASAGVLAQAVDALANPAWRSAEVSPLLWLVLGVGVAGVASRRTAGAGVAPEAGDRARRWAWTPAWRLGALLALIQIGAGASTAVLGEQPRVLRNFYDPRATPVLEVRDSLDFGRTRIGRTRIAQIIIRNQGMGSVLEGGLTIAPGPFAGDFQVIGPGRFYLAYRRSAAIRFRFTPSRLGPAEARVVIRSNAPEREVQLTGVGF